MALVESSFPHVLTPELDTVGPCDFDGRLTTAMTAHPKTDPVTGELHFFGYGFAPPFLTYHRLSARRASSSRAPRSTVPGADDDARLRDHRPARRVPRPADDVLARSASPARHALRLGRRLRRPDRRHAARPARRGHAGSTSIPAYVFHVGNAHTDAAGRVVLDAARYAPADAVAMWDGLGPTTPPGPPPPRPPPVPPGCTAGCSIPATGTVTETALDDRPVEFPTVDDDRVGRAARYRYAVARHRATPPDRQVRRRERARSPRTTSGADTVGGRGRVRAVVGAGPGRGRRLAAHDHHPARRQSASQLLVLDATDVGGAPGRGRDPAPRRAGGFPRVVDRRRGARRTMSQQTARRDAEARAASDAARPGW